MCWNQADMPLLRSFGRLAGGFYKHVAPTAPRLGSRTWRVFQQAANRLFQAIFFTSYGMALVIDHSNIVSNAGCSG